MDEEEREEGESRAATTPVPATKQNETKETVVLGGGEVRAGECVCCGSVFCYYCLHALSIPWIAAFRDCCVYRLCSPFCFKPPRPSWNRSFLAASDALRVVSRKLYLTEEDVRIVRLIDYTPIPKWLAPKTSMRVKSRKVLCGGRVKCEYFYPTRAPGPSEIKTKGRTYEKAEPTKQPSRVGPLIEKEKTTENGATKNSKQERLVTDAEKKDVTWILYLHGGAFIFTHSGHFRDSLHRAIGATGAHVIAPNFSRPPEHKYPVPMDECRDVYRWLLDRVDRPDKQIFLAGDSAGGGLVVSLLESIRSHKLPMPAGAVLISPWVDYADPCTGRSMTENNDLDYICPDLIKWIGNCYCPKTNADGTKSDLTPARISPTNCVLDDFPPILMFVGECEVLRDQQLAFAEKMKKAGVDLDLHVAEDMPHVYWLFAFTGMHEPNLVFSRLGDFVEKRGSVGGGGSGRRDGGDDEKEDDGDAAASKIVVVTEGGGDEDDAPPRLPAPASGASSQ